MSLENLTTSMSSSEPSTRCDCMLIGPLQGIDSGVGTTLRGSSLRSMMTDLDRALLPVRPLCITCLILMFLSLLLCLLHSGTVIYFTTPL